MSLSITLTINGAARAIALDDPRVTLLDLLRERLDLTGTKKGCDRGQCGACTVLIDGRRMNACLALALSLDGADILTIEGVANGEHLHPVRSAVRCIRRVLRMGHQPQNAASGIADAGNGIGAAIGIFREMGSRVSGGINITQYNLIVLLQCRKYLGRTYHKPPFAMGNRQTQALFRLYPFA